MANRKIDFTALNTLPGKELTLGSQPYNNLRLILLFVFFATPILSIVVKPYLSTDALSVFLVLMISLEAVLLFFIVIFNLKRKSFLKTIEANQSSIRESLKKFASTNNFSISMKETESDIKTLITSYVDFRTLERVPVVETKILQGQFAGFPMKLSDLLYAKAGKSQITQPLQGRVIRLTLPQKLPHMIMDCHIDSAATDAMGAPDLIGVNELKLEPSNVIMKKIGLEGDFHKYFSIYIEEKNTVDALSILTPDVMYKLLEMHAMCDIEIIDNYIHFVWSERKVSKAAYEKAFMTVQSVMEQIGYKLSHGDFTASTKRSSANVLAKNGGYTAIKGDIFDKKFGSSASIVVVIIVAVAIPVWIYRSGVFSSSDSIYAAAKTILVAVYVLPWLILAALPLSIICYVVILSRKRKKFNNEFRKRYRRK